MLETTKPKWYENKTLIVLLFFLLPPIGIYGMTKRKTVSWKKALYIVPASLLILFTIIGIIGAIFIDYYKSLNANFIIILTGGDADFLAMRLKNTIFANSNFLLESLNQTFQYTINND